MSQNKCIQILIHVEEENVQLQLWCMHVLKFSPWGRKALIKKSSLDVIKYKDDASTLYNFVICKNISHFINNLCG